MSSAQWIPARELRDTDVLEFQILTPLDPLPVGSLSPSVDGIPIDTLTRHPDGRITVDVTFIDGTHVYRTFDPDERVCVHDLGTDTPIRDVIQS